LVVGDRMDHSPNDSSRVLDLAVYSELADLIMKLT
jgi:hypothetical protein